MKHSQLQHQVQVNNQATIALSEQIRNNEARSQERHEQSMMFFHTAASLFGRAPPTSYMNRPVMGQSFPNMYGLDNRPLDDRLFLPPPPPLTPPQHRQRLLLPSPPVTTNTELAIVPLDSHAHRPPPSLVIRSQQQQPLVVTSPSSNPKKRKTSGADSSAEATIPLPIPSKGEDVSSIRGIVHEWLNSKPPHCSLRDMMKGDGVHFERWRNFHKSWIDHRKNIWWAISTRVQALTDDVRNDRTIVDQVIADLEEEKGKMTISAFIKTLPKPPKSMWRHRL